MTSSALLLACRVENVALIVVVCVVWLLLLVLLRCDGVLVVIDLSIGVVVVDVVAIIML